MTKKGILPARIGTIRTRLLIAFVSVVLLLVAVVGTAIALFGFPTVQQQSMKQLETVATLKEAEIRRWVRESQTALSSVLDGDETQWYLHWMLLEDERDPLRRVAHRRLQDHFRRAISQGNWFTELALIDPQGKVVVAIDRTEEGEDYSDQIFFREGLIGAYVGSPSILPTQPQMSVVFAEPLTDREGNTFVLIGRTDAEALEEIMIGQANLGETVEAYLVNGESVPVTPLAVAGEDRVRSQGIITALSNQRNGSTLYNNYRGRPVVGVYHWLPELQLVLMAEQEQSEAFGPIYATLGVIGVTALITIVVAMTVSLLITRSITTPLANLVETATRIAAGDLELTAEVERQDEIGELGQAFNSMTGQLRELIGSLEQRVADRTRDLERRAAQLRAAADLGQAAASMHELDNLLPQVTHLISERFGFYHVGIFLLDDRAEHAVLRAANSEGGQRMLARGHKLRVGRQGLVGYVTATGEPRIALDVGEDSVHFRNPDLLETRSEMALPLIAGGRVLGALNIQSTEEAAFSQEDIAVLQVLADQIAVAIESANLFSKTQEALETTRRAFGEVSRQAWEKTLRAHPELGFRSGERGVTAAQDVWRPEMEQALREGRTVQTSLPQSTSEPANGKQSLAVPIKVRGHVVGVLDTYKAEGSGHWTSEEIAALEEITEQLGAALESARLYQDTQRRAARERLTREITDEIRRASNAEGVIQTAVDELFRVLGTSHAFGKLEVAPTARDMGQTSHSQ